jgi:hypothetical protein
MSTAIDPLESRGDCGRGDAGLTGSQVVDGEGRAAESQMEVGRPAPADTVDAHHMETDGIGEREILVRELSQETDTAGLFAGADRDEPERFEILDEREELEGARAVVPPRNQPCPSATTSVVVISGGRAENSRRNSGW